MAKSKKETEKTEKEQEQKTDKEEKKQDKKKTKKKSKKTKKQESDSKKKTAKKQEKKSATKKSDKKSDSDKKAAQKDKSDKKKKAEVDKKTEADSQKEEESKKSEKSAAKKKDTEDKKEAEKEEKAESAASADEESVSKAEETTPKKERKGPKPQSMEELMDSTGYEPVVPHKGKKIKGTIIEKTDKMLKIDVNAKSYGVVAEQEFDFAQDYIEDLEVGDEIDATVISVENNRGQILLSLKGAASDAKWEYFETALDKEKKLEAKGIEVNKGGLIVLVNGVRGFVPSSQLSRRYLDHINDLKGKKFNVRAIEVDRERNRLIFSERHVSEEKQLSQTQQALSAVEEGNIYEGVISGVKSFGLFMTVEVPIDGSDLSDLVEDGELKPDHRGRNELPPENVGYVEGLIHISEISWEKVDHPKNYHQVGDRVLVKILGVDEAAGKLNLSIKRLKRDPWKKVAEEYPAGTTFTGKVSRIEPFGVFVDVMPGVDGLIHSSKLGSDVQLKKGDEVTVNVDNVDPERRRMSLSMVLTEVPMGYK